MDLELRDNEWKIDIEWGGAPLLDLVWLPVQTSPALGEVYQSLHPWREHGQRASSTPLPVPKNTSRLAKEHHSTCKINGSEVFSACVRWRRKVKRKAFINLRKIFINLWEKIGCFFTNFFFLLTIQLDSSQIPFIIGSSPTADSSQRDVGTSTIPHFQAWPLERCGTILSPLSPMTHCLPAEEGSM